MKRSSLPLLLTILVLAGCGAGSGDSSWNPLRWGGERDRGPRTLEPEGGYGVVAGDERPSIPHLLDARWEPLGEGRLLVVTGMGPTKGFHSAGLVPVTPQPAGRLSPDADGVLRLRFVALPPFEGTEAAQLPATAAIDAITVAQPLSFRQLSEIVRVEVIGASGILSIPR